MWKACILIPVIALTLSVGVSGINAQVETGEESLTPDHVHTALDELLVGERYNFDPGILDDPPWLVKFREWLNKFSSGGGSSPFDGLVFGNPLVISIIIAVAIGLMILFLFVRRLGQGRGLALVGVGNGEINDLDAFEAWGDIDSNKARAFASSGNFTEACSVLFRSALKGLGKSGWIRYRRSGASRGYLRQLRRSAELYPLFKNLLGRFEVAYYRKPSANEDDWTSMLGTYENLAKSATIHRPPAT